MLHHNPPCLQCILLNLRSLLELLIMTVSFIPVTLFKKTTFHDDSYNFIFPSFSDEKTRPSKSKWLIQYYTLVQWWNQKLKPEAWAHPLCSLHYQIYIIGRQTFFQVILFFSITITLIFISNSIVLIVINRKQQVFGFINFLPLHDLLFPYFLVIFTYLQRMCIGLTSVWKDFPFTKRYYITTK